MWAPLAGTTIELKSNCFRYSPPRITAINCSAMCAHHRPGVSFSACGGGAWWSVHEAGTSAQGARKSCVTCVNVKISSSVSWRILFSTFFFHFSDWAIGYRVCVGECVWSPEHALTSAPDFGAHMIYTQNDSTEVKIKRNRNDILYTPSHLRANGYSNKAKTKIHMNKYMCFRYNDDNAMDGWASAPWCVCRACLGVVDFLRISTVGDAVVCRRQLSANLLHACWRQIIYFCLCRNYSIFFRTQPPKNHNENIRAFFRLKYSYSSNIRHYGERQLPRDAKRHSIWHHM